MESYKKYMKEIEPKFIINNKGEIKLKESSKGVFEAASLNQLQTCIALNKLYNIAYAMNGSLRKGGYLEYTFDIDENNKLKVIKVSREKYSILPLFVRREDAEKVLQSEELRQLVADLFLYQSLPIKISY